MKKIIILSLILLFALCSYSQINNLSSEPAATTNFSETRIDTLNLNYLRIIDASDADTARIYDDGDTTRFESDNPFEMNQSLKLPGSSLYIGNVKLEDADGCLATNEFHAHGTGSIAGYMKFAQGTTPVTHKEAGHSILWSNDNKLYFEKEDGTDIEVPLTFETIEFTSTFDNTLITKYSGATVLVYNETNPAQGETSIVGGTVTKVGKLLAYQFHVVFDEDDEFILQMDASLIPGEIVSASAAGDDASLHQLGFRSPAGNYLRFNRDDAIDSDLDAHLIVWVDGGTETAVIPVGTFTGTAGSIPFSNGTSIVEDNANLFWDDVNNRLGLGTTTPEGALHIDPTNVPALRLDGSSTEGDIACATGDNLQIGDWNEGTTTFTKIAQFLRFNTEARFDLISGSEYTRLFFRDSDGDFGIYYHDGASGTTKFRIDGTDGHFELNGGDVEISDFTKLGSAAPAIKMKKLTGTTGGTEGDITNITHGLTVSKIIGCQVLVTQSSNNLVPPAFTAVVEHEYDFFVLASVVRIVLTATNSGSILNGAITVLLTYEN